MSKKYFAHTDLLATLEETGKASSIFKPAGTLGRHHLEIAFGNKPGEILARGVEFNRNYDAGMARYLLGYDTPRLIALSQWVTLEEGDTLGYDCGQVWRLIAPHRIKNPLYRALREENLRRDRITWVDESYVHEMDMDTLTRSDGNYAVFFNGEMTRALAPFGFATTKARKVGPIDQRYYLGDFYILKGTPHKKVAAFIKGVCNGTWKDCAPEECRIGRARGIRRHVDLIDHSAEEL